MSSIKAIGCIVFALVLMDRTYSEEAVVPNSVAAEAREAHLGYLKISGVVIDICVYEQEFTPSEAGGQEPIPLKAGTLIKRAVVTGVHKGNVKVGTKIEIVEYVADPPKNLTHFRSVVEGELLTFCYFGEAMPEPKNGRNVVNHNYLCFDRCKDEEVKAFVKLLDTNANKNAPSEQAAPSNGDKPPN